MLITLIFFSHFFVPRFRRFNFTYRSLELPEMTFEVDRDGVKVKMDAWQYMIIRLSEHSLEAGIPTTRDIYDLRRLEGKKSQDEKKRHFGDTPTKDQKKKKRKSE